MEAKIPMIQQKTESFYIRLEPSFKNSAIISMSVCHNL